MKNYDKFYAVMSMIQGDKILINEVRKYPFIYDQKHENYKDMKLKEETWNAIGATINVKPLDAKNRWRNLRDRYVREKKMLVTEGEEVYRRHEVWPYLEDMSFLWDLIVHRKSSNAPYSINPSNEEALKKLTKSKLKTDLKNLPPLIPKPMQDWFNSTLNGALANGVAHFENNTSSNNNSSNGDVIEVDPWACSMNQDNFNEDSDLKPSQSKLRKLLSEHQDDSRGETPNSPRSYDYNSMEPHTHQKNTSIPPNPPYDEDELFCLSVAASLKRFNSKTKAATKIKIQQILYDAEFQEDTSSSNDHNHA
ncbi:uncharacterized protein LOC135839326 isoform X2 [Planococcus citri]|uniref:uncharacterized protein LOC135839326 isoform X2 n=1 Tax=Planococcus citri TaxID=170843 RepID=UPI0031F7DA46